MTDFNRPKLIIERASNTKALSDFYCGIPIMDEFIHSGLNELVLTNQALYIVKDEKSEVVAFFCLEQGSYFIGESVKEKILSEMKPAPKPGLEEDSIFWDLTNHPSVELSYFAVNKNHQHRNIGKSVLESLIQKLSHSTEYTQPVLTVRALQTEDGKYSAVDFYKKCGFSLGEDFVEKRNILLYKVIPR